MLRFQGGDEEAFEELVRRNTSKIHSLAYRFLGENHAAEDVTQEAFIRIYRTAGRYSPKAKFSTWLYRIVANLCFNALRSRRRTKARPLELFTEGEGRFVRREIADRGAGDPGRGLKQEELAALVAAAVAALPDNQRIAIILNKYEEKSYDEIADVLDCSTMAVKSLLSRARADLRESLKRHLSHGD